LNPFEFAIVVVIAGLAYKAWDTHVKQKHAARGQRVDDGVEAKLARLEERIQVLERIVTDSQFDLRRQLNDLEDEASGSG
jgi:hypothetical protein